MQFIIVGTTLCLLPLNQLEIQLDMVCVVTKCISWPGNDKMQRIAWLLVMCVDTKYSSAQAASLQRMVRVVHIPRIV